MGDEAGRRLLFWEGSAKRDFTRFPIAVQKDLGVALFVVQIGGTPPSAKHWKGLGSGVYELIEDYRGDTYRAVYTVRITDAIHVLPRVSEEIEVREQNTEGRRGHDRGEVEGGIGASAQEEGSTVMTRDAIDRGTENVLADLGLPDADALAAKTILAKKINDILDSRGLAGSEAAGLLGISDSKLSAIRGYKLRGISLQRLMHALTALGQRVEIVVSPSNEETAARIDVAA